MIAWSRGTRTYVGRNLADLLLASAHGSRERRPVEFLATLAVGCGPADGVESRVPIASLDGILTAQDITSPPTSTFRVAVVWTDGQRLVATQDIAATPVFPSTFHLDFVDPPPTSVMTPDDSGTGLVALGSVVAYEDKNGNGALDLVDESANSFVDRVLGANENLMLLHAVGVPANSVTPALDGYHLFKLDACTPEEDCLLKLDILPMSTLFELPLTDAPVLSQLMRANGAGDSTTVTTEQDTETHVGPGPDGR